MSDSHKMTEINTEQEFMKKLASLGELDEDTRNHVVCSLLGHSKIHKFFFGTYYCSRCGDRLGSTLEGIYPTQDVVVIDHDCPTCRDNYDKLDWRNKIFTPDPFAKVVTNDD